MMAKLNYAQPLMTRDPVPGQIPSPRILLTPSGRLFLRDLTGFEGVTVSANPQVLMSDGSPHHFWGMHTVRPFREMLFLELSSSGPATGRLEWRRAGTDEWHGTGLVGTELGSVAGRTQGWMGLPLVAQQRLDQLRCANTTGSFTIDRVYQPSRMRGFDPRGPFAVLPHPRAITWLPGQSLLNQADGWLLGVLPWWIHGPLVLRIKASGTIANAQDLSSFTNGWYVCRLFGEALDTLPNWRVNPRESGICKALAVVAGGEMTVQPWSFDGEISFDALDPLESAAFSPAAGVAIVLLPPVRHRPTVGSGQPLVCVIEEISIVSPAAWTWKWEF